MSDEPVMTPIEPNEGVSAPPKVSPFAAAPVAPAVVAPTVAAAPAAPAPAPTASTIKLKPVIRKPMIHKPVIGGAKPPAPAAPAAPAAKKTQSLNSVTGPIPAQATLRKTGIVAEGILTPQQQQAAKSKTSRISLESAMGVAPVSPAAGGAAPLKTIRLRRPTDLKPPAPAAAPAPAPAPAPAAASAPAAEDAPTVATIPAVEPPADAGVTQKKTLKLHRPGGIGIKRPTMGINPPAGPAPADGGDAGDVPTMDAVPEIKPLSAIDLSSGEEAGTSAGGVPSWVAALSLAASVAALLVTGVVVWYLWQEGVGPGAGANAMPFIEM